jgi:ribonuclease D
MSPVFPALITRPADLQRLAETLSHETILAVDTESNSLYAYREQVCLIQFSTLRDDYLVDPITLENLSPLALLFSNPRIEKVFHAAEYDIICLRRDFGFQFANLFDTMLAARILGREAVGLGAILEIEFGVHLNKRCQRANWGQRPLPPYLLEYARQDTHYLISLRNRLRDELRQNGLDSLAIEDFDRMSGVSAIEGEGPTQPEDKIVDVWRISGAFDLKPQQAAVLLELCRYRDQVAHSNNRPLFKVIADRTLLAIAEALPQNLDELGQLPGMSRGQVERYGNPLLHAVQRGLAAEPIYPPRPVRPDEAFLGRVEALRNWRKATAQKMGVPSDVVLPRDLLFHLAQKNPGQAEDLAEVLSDVPWRAEHFGTQILDLLAQRKHA